MDNPVDDGADLGWLDDARLDPAGDDPDRRYGSVADDDGPADPAELGDPEDGADAEVAPAPSDLSGPSDPPDSDLAAAALAGARHGAGRRPARGDRETRRRIRRENLAGRNGGVNRTGRNVPGYSGPAADPDRDPHLVGNLLGHLVAEQGWDRPLADARVFADWASLVGDDIAAHAHPQSLTAGELRIVAESTAWATQLRLLSATLLARLVAELGPQVVTKLHITGPSAPSWKHGSRSVRGHRGPRDTYG